MNRKIALYIGGALLAVALLIGIGFGIATWRYQARLAQSDAREQARMAEIAARDAESNKLRGENDVLRKDIAELTQEKAAILQNIKEHGGAIAAETKKLEQINETLKTDQAIVSAPSDVCTRCRRFSANAVKQRLIDKPLACTDECRGVN